MTGTTYGIVAGYDGSPGAAQALRWAAREAFARGTTLTVCLAWTPDHMDLPTESALCDLARQHGQEILTRGLPYALFVKGGHDGEGAVRSVERIVTGLAWKAVLAPVLVVGEIDESALEQCHELGITFAAGLEAGVF